MADFILVTGDKAVFSGILGEAFIIQPTILTANLIGTGNKVKINQKPICIEGDEKKVMVPAMQPSAPSPIPDTTPQYNGTGTFKSIQNSKLEIQKKEIYKMKMIW